MVDLLIDTFLQQKNSLQNPIPAGTPPAAGGAPAATGASATGASAAGASAAATAMKTNNNPIGRIMTENHLTKAELNGFEKTMELAEGTLKYGADAGEGGRQITHARKCRVLADPANMGKQ